MGRIRGDVLAASRLEPVFSGPIDARCKVEFFADLINENTWKDNEGKAWLDSSLIVRVYNDDESLNGFYHLLNDGSDFKLPESWVRFGDCSGSGGITSHEFRFASVMQSNEQIMPIGEPLLLYNSNCKHISKLEIKSNVDTDINWVDVPINTEVNIDLSMYVDTDILIRITRDSVDSFPATLYLFLTKIV